MSEASLPAVKVGTELPARSVRLTRADLVRYAGASTDFNPIHYSDQAAGKVGLPGVVPRGMLTMGIAMSVVTAWLSDPTRLLSYSARFTQPVLVPEDVGTELPVTATVAAIEAGVATIAIEALCEGQKVLGAARAEVAVGAAR